jgi:hypothetical protein
MLATVEFKAGNPPGNELVETHRVSRALDCLRVLLAGNSCQSTGRGKVAGNANCRPITAEFSAADRQQEIDLSIDGCRFALRNEQRLPHHSLQKPYAEYSVFNLALLSTRTDQVVKKPNKLTTFVMAHDARSFQE